MRIRLVSALCVVLPLICSSHPAAAQFNPSIPQLPQASFRKLPSPAKLSEFQRGGDLGHRASSSDLANETTNTLRSLRYLLGQRDVANAVEKPSPVEAAQCAHIVMFPAPDVDPKMIIEVPKEAGGSMSTFEGLQACRADYSREVSFLQLPPNAGSWRIGARAPIAVMQFDGQGWLFPRNDSRQRRDKPVPPLAWQAPQKSNESPRH
jgi:hypothetical protein